MDMDYMKSTLALEGKRAVVTGASQGIGRAVAEALAKLGANVAALGRNRAYLDEVEAAIAAAGGSCKGYVVDVSREAQMDAFFKEYLAGAGGIDIFVNNAAYTTVKPVAETTEAEMDGMFATNIKGMVFGVSRAAQVMKKQGGGNIVIVTSVNALYPLPSQGFYTGTKAMLETLTRCLAMDYAPYNIRVNSCAPGGVNTNMNTVFFPDEASLLAAGKDIPLGHIAQPEEIGDAVAAMLTGAFRYMTGSTVLVDGGLMLRNA